MSQETLRKLIECAIACGRKRLNPQTGFVHHYYQSEGSEVAVTIPTLENMVFALALLRSRNADNILEAKSLLERILPFQSEGNFPVYIHDYPLCRDRYLSYQLLPPLYWILSQFHAVLGQELKKKLTSVAQTLLHAALQIQEEKPAPSQLAIKLYASAEAFGRYWQEEALKEKGAQGLQTLDSASWYSPGQLGDWMSALQLAETPNPGFWQHISNTWDRNSCSYCGPAVKEYQQGFEPQPTLYDLFLGYMTDALSSRALADGIHLLHGALIQPTTQALPEPTVVPCAVTFAIAERDKSWNQANDKSFHPLRMVWGSPKRLHTFVCQGGNVRSYQSLLEDAAIDFVFELGDPIESDDREKNREIAFYLDLSDAHRITVNGVAATTFTTADTVCINSGSLALTLTFQVVEGEGTFMGHIMKGNRPAQISLKGDNRFNAYDWQIFLRTVRRTGPSHIRACIHYSNEVSQ